MTLLFLLILLLNACSLVNQELPNESPTLESSTINTNQVRRGGSVRLEILAADEDDDPLSFTWQSISLDATVVDTAGNGTFLTPNASSTTWVAPEQIGGESAEFLITVIVRDRFCGIIEDREERSNCEEESFELVESFTVEVTQRQPSLSLPTEITASFSDPFIEIEALASDEDGDPLQVTWSQLDGPELPLQQPRLDEGLSRLQVIPFYTGDYIFQAMVSDGSDSASQEITVHVLPDDSAAAPNADGMIELTLPSGEAYEIDAYEYSEADEALPKLVESWFEAYRICKNQGKRLCTTMEWTNACQGEDQHSYSSTDALSSPGRPPIGERFCNSPDATAAEEIPALAAPGSFPNCTSGNGVYDLTGNAREWVGYTKITDVWVGGYNASGFQDVPPGGCGSFEELQQLPVAHPILDSGKDDALGADYDGYKKPEIGFRCCR
jgi:hypothetical protein